LNNTYTDYNFSKNILELYVARTFMSIIIRETDYKSSNNLSKIVEEDDNEHYSSGNTL